MHFAKIALLTAGIATVFALFACQTHHLTPSEGYVNVTGGRVWYRIVGSGSRTPLLVVNGGPGNSSHYVKPLSALADERPVIFYDQLGCGRSDRPDDTTLWRIERFVEEIAQVRKALGLEEVHLYGHSWGAMLAVDYMLTKPKGIESLILGSPPLSISRWFQDADTLLATLPDSIQKVVRAGERENKRNTPEYQSALMFYLQQFVARKLPWSLDLDSCNSQSSSAIYVYMWGPSEFQCGGKLCDYDCTAELCAIKVPVLFTAGQFDAVRPQTMKYYQSLVPGSELAILANCAHLTMHDDSAAYNGIIREFLDRVDAK
jgi:proline iminopeptidase